MSKDFMFINSNISYYLKDVIDKYDLKVAKVSDDTTILYKDNYCFYISMDITAAHISYIFKDKCLSEYYHENIELYLKKIFCFNERYVNLQRGYINYFNIDLFNFSKRMPHQIEIVYSLVNIKKLLDYSNHLISQHGDSWIDNYYKYKINFSDGERCKLKNNELKQIIIKYI